MIVMFLFPWDGRLHMVSKCHYITYIVHTLSKLMDHLVSDNQPRRLMKGELFTSLFYIINLNKMASFTIRRSTTPTAMAIAHGGGMAGASGCQHSMSSSLQIWHTVQKQTPRLRLSYWDQSLNHSSWNVDI